MADIIRKIDMRKPVPGSKTRELIARIDRDQAEREKAEEYRVRRLAELEHAVESPYASVQTLMAHVDALEEDMRIRRERYEQGVMQQRRASPLHKTYTNAGHKGLEYILSTENVDRYSDVILLSAWHPPALDKFRKNPICLFGHDSNFPVGTWKGVDVRDGALRGYLELAPASTSPRVAEVVALVGAGVVKATSVGFLGLEFSPLPSGGKKYSRVELCEVSLVATPANADCLEVAKSLNISDETLKRVFT